MAFRRRRTARERLEWLFAVSVTPTTAAVNSLNSQVLISSATFEEFTQPRLARIMGTIFVSPATAPAAATGYGAFLGITRVAASGGNNANPDPEASLDWPSWVWWNACFPQIGGTGAADSNASRWVGYFRFDINMRTRLRIHENDILLMQVKNSNSSGASIQFSYALRFLVAAGRK